MRFVRTRAILVCLAAGMTVCSAQGVQVGRFPQEVRTFYTSSQGLPSDDVRAVAVAADVAVYAATSQGLARFDNGHWVSVAERGRSVEQVAAGPDAVWYVAGGSLLKWSEGKSTVAAQLSGLKLNSIAAGAQVFVTTDQGLYVLAGGRLLPDMDLQRLLGASPRVGQVAVAADGRVAVAAASGLYLRMPHDAWHPVYPRSGNRSWAPYDVRAVSFDSRGRLWFASPQGVGVEDAGVWTLYTGQDGLPYDDFTTVACGGDGAVWFGTRIGAERFDGTNWEYRQGLRWLPDDDVRSIAVNANGDAWFATSKGVSYIERRPTTLQEKARLFEDGIDKRHRRTPYGYVLEVRLKRPGDLSEWEQQDSDNDGLWTSMYGAGECYAYAATGDAGAKQRAKAAFEALRFLRIVTQGGDHPAPAGFVARTVLPASGNDPNKTWYTPEKDAREQATKDRLWKVISPRWPTSADGKWYWKSDTSSDELDGHYFFYAQYYDLVADTPEEKARVREQVAGLTDHLISHGFQLVDHDGKVARWGVFDPANLNHSRDWWEERGTNSLSMLSYLKTAEHITGDARYAQAARELIEKHGYDANVLIQKTNAGPGAANQSDDEMVFMCFYNLLKYETDPVLKERWALAFALRMRNEAPELNPLFNFMYAALNAKAVYHDAFGAMDLAPKGEWLAESLDTLRRYPLDRVDWRMTNHQRKDLVPLSEAAEGDGGKRGHRYNGKVLPIDERFVNHWNHDSWEFDQGGEGKELADGASFLLPYYMGLYHKIIVEKPQ
jgi:hypothetical protein